MITVYVLNLYGYEQYKAKTLVSDVELKDCMFYLVSVLPILIGCVQFFCWRRYGIKNSHLKQKQEDMDGPVDFEEFL